MYQKGYRLNQFVIYKQVSRNKKSVRNQPAALLPKLAHDLQLLNVTCLQKYLLVAGDRIKHFLSLNASMSYYHSSYQLRLHYWPGDPKNALFA